jgi:DNA mismatch endonuclease, patch repair protein
MADRLTPEQRRLNMSRVRGKDTAPELIVRRLLHSTGFRYRLHRRGLPGRPDIVLPKHDAAVQVHGCFWHGHACPLFRLPDTRTEFWRAKIEGNRRRDLAAVTALRALGWRTLIVWECALKGPGRLPHEQLGRRLHDFVIGATADDEIAGCYSRSAGGLEGG